MHLSSYPELQGLRIGCVQYLNAKPLIYGCTEAVHFGHPSDLAKLLAAGELDVALVPVFELFQHPDYFVVDGVAIASSGPVYSVFLAHEGPLDCVRSVVLDPASLTSSHLVRCILSEFHGLRPEYSPAGVGAAQSPEGARLLIGNQAIRFREENAAGWHYLDLGEEWTKHTSLPFVFAAWLMRRDLREPGKAAAAFRRMKQSGQAHVSEIAADQEWPDPEFSRRYLTEYIRFDLGVPEKKGMELFRTLLSRNCGIPIPDSGIQFV